MRREDCPEEKKERLTQELHSLVQGNIKVHLYYLNLEVQAATGCGFQKVLLCVWISDASFIHIYSPPSQNSTHKRHFVKQVVKYVFIFLA